MKKIKHLLVALITLVAATNVYAAEVDSAAALLTCTAAEGMCTLSTDVVLTSSLEIKENIILDLNGHAITPADTFAGDSLIIVLHGGTLTVQDSVGTGKISTGDANPNVFVGVKMTKAGCDYSNKASLILTSGTIEGLTFGISGNGNADRGNTSIIISGGKVAALEATGTAIYHPQNGTLKIAGGTIVGGTGIEMRSGELEVTGGTITGTAVPSSSNANSNGTTTLGAGIAIAQHTTKQNISVSISGGTVEGYKALYQTNPQSNDSTALDKVTLEVTGGTFEVINGGDAAIFSENYEGFVSGGEFSDDVAEKYLASSELVSKEQEDGSYIVGIEHTITVATVKNGKVVVSQEKAIAGETIKITSTPDEGYKVGEVKVALADETAAGVVEGDAAGFIMPNGDVVVTVTFVEDAPIANEGGESIKNPDTSDSLMVYVTLATISIAGLSVVAVNKKRFN